MKINGLSNINYEKSDDVQEKKQEFHLFQNNLDSNSLTSGLILEIDAIQIRLKELEKEISELKSSISLTYA